MKFPNVTRSKKKKSQFGFKIRLALVGNYDGCFFSDDTGGVCQEPVAADLSPRMCPSEALDSASDQTQLPRSFAAPPQGHVPPSPPSVFCESWWWVRERLASLRHRLVSIRGRLPCQGRQQTVERPRVRKLEMPWVGRGGWGWGSAVTGGHSQSPSAGVSVGLQTHRCSGIFVSWLLPRW